MENKEKEQIETVSIRKNVKKSDEKIKSILLVYIVPLANFVLLIYEVIMNFELEYSFLFLFLSGASVVNATNTGIACTMGNLKSYDDNNELIKNRNIGIVASSLLFFGSYMLLSRNNYKNPGSIYYANLFLTVIIFIFTIMVTLMIIQAYIRVVDYQYKLFKDDFEAKPNADDLNEIDEMHKKNKASVEGGEYIG